MSGAVGSACPEGCDLASLDSSVRRSQMDVIAEEPLHSAPPEKSLRVARVVAFLGSR